MSNIVITTGIIKKQDPTIIIVQCTTAMESLSRTVDNTYKLFCNIKSKTLSNKDFKKPWISREII